jgi:hypothetical protein
MIAVEKPELEFVVPGRFADVRGQYVHPGHAPHQKNAELLMNFLLKPENAARLVTRSITRCRLRREWIDEEFATIRDLSPQR